MSNNILEVTGIFDPATLACLARARKYSQYENGVKDALAGRCPFCDQNTEDGKFIDLPSSKLMRARHCNPPEKYTAFHFLITPIRHVTAVRQLTMEEWLEIASIITELENIFNFQYSGLLCRNGDATKSAGTIQHLHFHVMVPNGTGRVESPFCKTPEEEAAGVDRAIVFEKIRTGTRLEDLTDEERARIANRL